MGLAMLAVNEYENVSEIGINYIERHYNTYLDDAKKNSFNTFKSYRGDLEQFFLTLYNKEPQHVTIEDMVNTTGDDIVQYRNELREMKYRNKNYKNSTVNRKINAVRSFFSYMETDYTEIRSAIFNNTKKLKENDSEGWGSLTPEEVFTMVELSKEYTDGEELSTLIELGFITAIRLDALLTATYNNNIFLRHDGGQDIWVIDVIDKEQRHIKAISNDLKEKLDSLGRFGDKVIFKSFHEHKVGDAIRQLVKDMEIDERRNIRFHSLKKASINFVLNSTGDVKQAQLQGNHKSARTTLDSYVAKNNKLSQQPSLYMGTEIDTSPLHELTHEELLKIIESSSSALQLELLRNINKK